MRAVASFGLTFAVAGIVRYLGQPIWFAVLCGVAVAILVPVFLQYLAMRNRR